MQVARTINLAIAGAVTGGLQCLLQLDNHLKSGERYAESVGRFVIAAACFFAAVWFFWVLFGVGAYFKKIHVPDLDEERYVYDGDTGVWLTLVAVCLAILWGIFLPRPAWAGFLPGASTLLVTAAMIRLIQWNGLEPDGLAVYEPASATSSRGRLSLVA